MSNRTNVIACSTVALFFVAYGATGQTNVSVERVPVEYWRPPVEYWRKNQIVKKVDPGYTAEALKAKIEGWVVLRLEISEQGKAENISIAKSLDAGLDEEAIKAVRQWKFAPGEKDGKPARVFATIELHFTIPPSVNVPNSK